MIRGTGVLVGRGVPHRLRPSHGDRRPLSPQVPPQRRPRPHRSRPGLDRGRRCHPGSRSLEPTATSACAASRSRRSTTPRCSPRSPPPRPSAACATSRASARPSCGSQPRAATTPTTAGAALSGHHQARRSARARRRRGARRDPGDPQARVRRAARSARAGRAREERRGRRTCGIAAVARIDDGDVLRALAIDTTHEGGRARGGREARRRRAARERRAEGQEQGGAPEGAQDRHRDRRRPSARRSPGVPDEVKRRRAEKAQLLREVEAVADSFDFAKVDARSCSAAEAAWAALGGDDDGDERFAKARRAVLEAQGDPRAAGAHAPTSCARSSARPQRRDGARRAERAAARPRPAPPRPSGTVRESRADEPSARRARPRRRRAARSATGSAPRTRRGAQAQAAERAAKREGRRRARRGDRGEPRRDVRRHGAARGARRQGRRARSIACCAGGEGVRADRQGRRRPSATRSPIATAPRAASS